jgi:hypothetical protein
MRCPNPSCPYITRHGRSASYRADALRCSDCGAELVDDRAEAPSTSVASAHVAPVAALSFPLAVVAALVVSVLAAAIGPALSFVPLPSVDGLALSASNLAGLSVGALGITPWLEAALVVEIAAVLVPRWRPLRHGGPATRARLARASLGVGAVFALVQALMHTAWLGGVEQLVPALLAFGARIFVVAALIVGCCLVRLAVVVVERFGIGNGFAVIVAGSAVESLLTAPPTGLVAVAAGALVAVGVTWWAVRVVDDDDELFVVRPSAGIVPAGVGVGVASVAVLAGAPPESGVVGASIAATIVCVLLFARLFSSSTTAATLLARLAGRAPTTEEFARAATAAREALPITFLINGAVLASFLVGDVEIVELMVLVAVIKDVVVEAQARRRAGTLMPIWSLRRFVLVQPVLKALADVGIEAHLRGAHQRALGHFFVPYVPIDVLVPANEASRACIIVAELAATAEGAR